MRKILLIVAVVLCLFDSYGQRKRRILFDADTKTPVDSGFYGVGIVDNQAYLINHRKDSIQFKMEYPYIRALNTGKDLTITLTRTSPTLIFAVKDSITFTLPSASDTLNKYVKYDIHYLGWRGGTGVNKYVPFDTTYRMVFSDSVRFYNSANQTTYRTKVFNSWNVTKNWFKLYPYRRLTLEVISSKWYLTLNDFDY